MNECDFEESLESEHFRGFDLTDEQFQECLGIQNHLRLYNFAEAFDGLSHVLSTPDLPPAVKDLLTSWTHICTLKMQTFNIFLDEHLLQTHTWINVDGDGCFRYRYEGMPKHMKLSLVLQVDLSLPETMAITGEHQLMKEWHPVVRECVGLPTKYPSAYRDCSLASISCLPSFLKLDLQVPEEKIRKVDMNRFLIMERASAPDQESKEFSSVSLKSCAAINYLLIHLPAGPSKTFLLFESSGEVPHIPAKIIHTFLKHVCARLEQKVAEFPSLLANNPQFWQEAIKEDVKGKYSLGTSVLDALLNDPTELSKRQTWESAEIRDQVASLLSS